MHIYQLDWICVATQLFGPTQQQTLMIPRRSQIKMKLVGSILVAFLTTFVAGKVGSSNLRQATGAGAQKSLADYENDKCTTIIVGPKAGIEGPMTTHTADCADCDFRIGKVPARDWPAGTMRPLYMYKDQYPSVVSANRGATWHPDNLQGNAEQLAAWGKESVPSAYIPQVAHTFALLEGGYAIMNEHQVAIGESTCAARFWGVPVTAGGLAKIEVAEMSKIALERSTTARQAIQLMGDLATELGFYAADWSGGDRSSGEAGEALTVIDKTEAWVFHVLGDDTGTSAVWAAQRLEPDHVSVVANSFVIRKIDEHSENFMYSANIFEVAERNKLWSRASGQQLDFLPTFAPTRSHPEYSTRRVWRVLSQVAPSLNLPGETDAYGNDYPFSVKAERILTPADLIAFNSDHFEGTPYDLTQGLAAGPYGDPNRFDGSFTNNMTVMELLSGGYERAISMFRTSYSFVATARPDVPDSFALIWFSQYNPASSSYAPFYVAAEHVPTAYTRGSLGQGYDSAVAYWNFLAVGNYAGRFYKYAMVDVRAAIARIHAQLVQNVAAHEKTLLSQTDATKVVKALTAFTNEKGEFIQTEWRNLLPQIITKFHDGMIATALDQPSIVMKRLFYPKWWLEATGYFLHHGNFGPGVILFEPAPASADTSGISYSASLVLTAVGSSLVTVLGVMYVLNRQNKRHEYTPIPSANL